MKPYIKFTYLTFANLNLGPLKIFVNCGIINIYLHTDLQMLLQM